MKETDIAIMAQGVHKQYAGAAKGAGLNGFDLQVPAGTVCGLLGPNGAGKTTAIRILSTLLDFTVGRAWIAGFDVRTHPWHVRERIGLVGQYAAVDEIFTGRQNLVLFGRLHHLSSTAVTRRADELLERFSLATPSKQPVSTYSGGMPIINHAMPTTSFLARRGWALRDARTIARRDLNYWALQPGTVMLGWLFPVMVVLMFGGLFGGAIRVPDGGRYVEFFMPGMFATTMLFGGRNNHACRHHRCRQRCH